MESYFWKHVLDLEQIYRVKLGVYTNFKESYFVNSSIFDLGLMNLSKGIGTGTTVVRSSSTRRQSAHTGTCTCMVLLYRSVVAGSAARVVGVVGGCSTG